ncbi:MAG: tetratricopeptide repeat protein [Chloroflexota bacterium]|nr:tetratricopeptide repeat protein [Chloroflexota bacterium]
MDAEALHAEAMRLYQAGQLNDAMAAFEQARAGFAAQGNAAQAASVANDLGVVYYLGGRNQHALPVLQEALAAYERLGDGNGQAKALGNLAQLHKRTGDKAAAEKNYQRAAELFHQSGDRAMEHDTYRALSQIQLQRWHLLEALAAYDRALAAKGGAGLLRAFLQIPLRLAGVRR